MFDSLLNLLKLLTDQIYKKNKRCYHFLFFVQHSLKNAHVETKICLATSLFRS